MCGTHLYSSYGFFLPLVKLKLPKTRSNIQLLWTKYFKANWHKFFNLRTIVFHFKRSLLILLLETILPQFLHETYWNIKFHQNSSKSLEFCPKKRQGIGGIKTSRKVTIKATRLKQPTEQHVAHIKPTELWRRKLSKVSGRRQLPAAAVSGKYISICTPGS